MPETLLLNAVCHYSTLSRSATFNVWFVDSRVKPGSWISNWIKGISLPLMTLDHGSPMTLDNCYVLLLNIL